MFSLTQKVLRLTNLLVVSTFTIFFAFIVIFIFGIHLQSRQVDTHIALWLDHAWSTGQDLAPLQQQIATAKITDLYFHVGPIGPQGQLATDLQIPDLSVLPTTNYAWIGQLRSQIDLAATQDDIIKSAEWLMQQGFDGIHLDIEPITEDDTEFYNLLARLNSELPNAKISVATFEWQPSSLGIGSYWTSSQFKKTASHADQIVVMTYQTVFHDPALYTWWVEQQATRISNIIDTQLLIGLPVYEHNIDPSAENLKSGLTGYQNAVQNLRTDRSTLDGIAIYPYWEMDQNDWQLLNETYPR